MILYCIWTGDFSSIIQLYYIIQCIPCHGLWHSWSWFASSLHSILVVGCSTCPSNNITNKCNFVKKKGQAQYFWAKCQVRNEVCTICQQNESKARVYYVIYFIQQNLHSVQYSVFCILYSTDKVWKWLSRCHAMDTVHITSSCQLHTFLLLCSHHNNLSLTILSPMTKAHILTKISKSTFSPML